VLCVLAIAVFASCTWADTSILNVSYDVTREFYRDIDVAFAAKWKASTGENITIKQSHGGSSMQARAVVDGLEADVVTMNQAPDIDLLASAGGLIPSDWASRLPDHSVPYTSTIVFIVRRGNPKGIKDWSDLVKPGVSVVIPNPKTSGNGRYSYLAAWGYALRRPGADEPGAREFVRKLFANVPVLDAGGRGAATTFARNGIGDVLLTFESEVSLIQREFGAEAFSEVVPSISIVAENPVVWVDRYVQKHGTEGIARAYLEFLYSEEGQEIAAKHSFRPRNPAVLARHAADFPAFPQFTVEDVAGSWAGAQKAHFADGGIFDQIYTNR
jgi:sulfate/thiosulfate transport system substrate-binding protein